MNAGHDHRDYVSVAKRARLLEKLLYLLVGVYLVSAMQAGLMIAHNRHAPESLRLSPVASIWQNAEAAGLSQQDQRWLDGFTVHYFSQAVLLLIQMTLGTVVGILFLRWLFRAHRNLPGLGVRQVHYRSGWAIGGFLVPIASLYIPWRFTRETWYGSDAGTSEDDAWTVETPGPGLISWWWGLFLAMSFMNIIAMSLQTRVKTLSDLEPSNWAGILAYTTVMAAAIATIYVVRAITSMQTEKADRLMMEPIPKRV